MMPRPLESGMAMPDPLRGPKLGLQKCDHSGRNGANIVMTPNEMWPNRIQRRCHARHKSRSDRGGGFQCWLGEADGLA